MRSDAGRRGGNERARPRWRRTWMRSGAGWTGGKQRDCPLQGGEVWEEHEETTTEQKGQERRKPQRRLRHEAARGR